MSGAAACRFDAAIVDLDGTMVDSVLDFVAALNAALGELGLPAVERGFVERAVGKGSEHLIRLTLAHVGGAALYEPAAALYQRHYRSVNGRQAQVYAGVEAGLAKLGARGLRLACVTNKPTDFAQALLATTGLARFFDVTFGGDTFERRKPDPMPLIEACRALGSSPARTLVIGDSSNDAAAARAAGCPVVLVTYGYNHGEPVRAVDADGFIERLDELAV